MFFNTQIVARYDFYRYMYLQNRVDFSVAVVFLLRISLVFRQDVYVLNKSVCVNQIT